MQNCSNDNISDESQIQEFLTLVNDLKQKIMEVKEQVQGVSNKPTPNTLSGVSLLTVKYHLLLQYITNLTFIIYLKLEGKSIENHPVIANLVELRVVLEKLRPVEGKLKYQIDKLIRAATVGGGDENDNGNDTMDPLAFKPNPENLLSRDDDRVEQSDEETSKVYRAPRMAPVHFDEDKGKLLKREKDKARQSVRASKSRLMKDIMAEYTDQPEEIDAMGGVHEGIGFGDGMDERMGKRVRYEEENFVRLPMSKKEIKKLRKGGVSRFENEFENLNDFRGFTNIHDSDQKDA